LWDRASALMIDWSPIAKRVFTFNGGGGNDATANDGKTEDGR
jgi:hypothetical protein